MWITVGHVFESPTHCTYNTSNSVRSNTNMKHQFSLNKTWQMDIIRNRVHCGAQQNLLITSFLYCWLLPWFYQRPGIKSHVKKYGLFGVINNFTSKTLFWFRKGMTNSNAIYYRTDGTSNMLVLGIRVKLLPDYSIKSHIIKMQW